MGRKSTNTSTQNAAHKPEGTTKKRTPQSAFDPASGKDIYEPEEIVAVRTARGVTQWQQVKWVGYSSMANTWEPIEHLAGCEDMIAEFERRKKQEDDRVQADALRAKKKAEEAARRIAAIRDSTVHRCDEDVEPQVERSESVHNQQELKVKACKRTSEVWSCYTERAGATKAKCAFCTLPNRDDATKVCGEQISFGAGTTALWNHVMWTHPDENIIKL
mmetsp:Transcript_49545/g.123174  ORF Transcript_49545/g.123174 Transcript_49545/m.123174 type:complete len:218 (-) Transcript_49545:346-999(-)